MVLVLAALISLYRGEDWPKKLYQQTIERCAAPESGVTRERPYTPPHDAERSQAHWIRACFGSRRLPKAGTIRSFRTESIQLSKQQNGKLGITLCKLSLGLVITESNDTRIRPYSIVVAVNHVPLLCEPSKKALHRIQTLESQPVLLEVFHPQQNTLQSVLCVEGLAPFTWAPAAPNLVSIQRDTHNRIPPHSILFDVNGQSWKSHVQYAQLLQRTTHLQLSYIPRPCSSATYSHDGVHIQYLPMDYALQSLCFAGTPRPETSLPKLTNYTSYWNLREALQVLLELDNVRLCLPSIMAFLKECPNDDDTVWNQLLDACQDPTTASIAYLWAQTLQIPNLPLALERRWPECRDSYESIRAFGRDQTHCIARNPLHITESLEDQQTTQLPSAHQPILLSFQSSIVEYEPETTIQDEHPPLQFDTQGHLVGRTPRPDAAVHTIPRTRRRRRRLLFKHDVRQDALAMQFIRICDSLIRDAGLDLRIRTFECCPAGPECGVIDWVNQAVPLSQTPDLQVYFRSVSFDAAAPYCIRSEIMDTYVKSCAGYAVISYILGVGDRHLDNILVHPSGTLFHCDFGYLLGRDPKRYMPLRLTPSMVDGMGGIDSDNYQKFLGYAGAAFLVLRRPTSVRRMLNCLRVMSVLELPDLSESTLETAVARLVTRLRLGLDDPGALEYLEQLLGSSRTNKLWLAVDAIHTIGKRVNSK